MILKTITNIFLSLLCFISLMVSARESKQDLIHLSSDTIQYNYKNGVILYEGHVHAVQNLTQLYANTMTVYYKQNKINKIIAKGLPAYYETAKAAKSDLFHAWANTIVYMPIDEKVKLTGNVKIQQRGNQFSGPQLLYDMKNQRVTSFPSQKSRAQLIIEPINVLKTHS